MNEAGTGSALIYASQSSAMSGAINFVWIIAKPIAVVFLSADFNITDFPAMLAWLFSGAFKSGL
jgi:hypothetical protein